MLGCCIKDAKRETRFDIIYAMQTNNTTDKILRSGTLRVIEYDVRPINKDGDAIDAIPCQSLAEARALRGFGDDCVAIVIEKHTCYRPAHRTPRGQEPDSYITIETSGDREALFDGGWI